MGEALAAPRLLGTIRSHAAFYGYVAVCGILGATMLAVAARHLSYGDWLTLGAPFAVVAGLVVLLELRPVVTAGAYDPQGVTVSTAFVFAILFYWGPWPALIVHAVGILVGEWASGSRCPS